jgi:hypothetical protein
MIATAKKPRRRTPTDGGAAPVAAARHAPPLTDEQLRVLHQVYGIILAHGSPAGTP